MLDLQTIAAIVFLIALTIFVCFKRKSLDTKQIIPYFLYFSMYKTKLGLKLMDSAAKKYRKLMLYIGYFGVLVGFLGMLLISYSLIHNVYALFTKPEAASGVGLVLPFRGKGIFFVPFFYWIISIFVIAVVHEFAHGLISRAHNLKVKSSGFAFVGTGFRGGGIAIIVLSLFFKIKGGSDIIGLGAFDFMSYSSPDFWILVGLALILVSYIRQISSFAHVPIIPAAFVEPDEKELRKKPHKEQLSVFAAGPLANIITAFICIGIVYFFIAPLANAIIEPDGVKITDYVKEKEPYPAEKAGIKIGEIIRQADGKPTPLVANLSAILKSKKPNAIVAIKTDKSSYDIRLAKNPQNESLAYIGAYLEQNTKIKEDIRANYGKFLPSALIWAYGLFAILFILNLGIGLFNLVPIGPLDGGRMLQLLLHRLFDREKGDRYWGYIGVFFFVLIFVNLVAGLVK